MDFRIAGRLVFFGCMRNKLVYRLTEAVCMVLCRFLVDVPQDKLKYLHSCLLVVMSSRPPRLGTVVPILFNGAWRG